MVIEQMLKDWIAERNAAVDLSVAARSVKSLAAEIEAHFNDQLARARAEAQEKAQQLAEKEGSLNKALDVIGRLEGQLAQLRDRGERQLAVKDRLVEEKDQALLASLQNLARLEAQFASSREQMEAKLEKAEGRLAAAVEELGQKRELVVGLERDLAEKDRLLDSYRQKFGVIIQAVK